LSSPSSPSPRADSLWKLFTWPIMRHLNQLWNSHHVVTRFPKLHHCRSFRVSPKVVWVDRPPLMRSSCNWSVSLLTDPIYDTHWLNVAWGDHAPIFLLSSILADYFNDVEYEFGKYILDIPP
jgi:hypothetical protein